MHHLVHQLWLARYSEFTVGAPPRRAESLEAVELFGTEPKVMSTTWSRDSELTGDKLREPVDIGRVPCADLHGGIGVVGHIVAVPGDELFQERLNGVLLGARREGETERKQNLSHTKITHGCPCAVCSRCDLSWS